MHVCIACIECNVLLAVRGTLYVAYGTDCHELAASLAGSRLDFGRCNFFQSRMLEEHSMFNRHAGSIASDGETLTLSMGVLHAVIGKGSAKRLCHNFAHAVGPVQSFHHVL